jgi:hypothetical protein
MKLALGTLFLAISGVAFAEQNSCNFTRYKVCAESADVDFSEECGQRGGVIGTVCPTDSRLGTCELKEDDVTMYVRFYSGYPGDAEKNCNDENGTYIPG